MIQILFTLHSFQLLAVVPGKAVQDGISVGAFDATCMWETLMEFLAPSLSLAEQQLHARL